LGVQQFGFNDAFDISQDGRFLIPARPEQSSATPRTTAGKWTAALPK
jgi:hypothetical protein